MIAFAFALAALYYDILIVRNTLNQNNLNST